MEMGTSWEGIKRGALNRLGWRKSVRSLCWPQAAWYCGEFLVLVVVIVESNTRNNIDVWDYRY